MSDRLAAQSNATPAYRYYATLVYHVPRSQVWQGSRGGQSGHAHLHVTEGFTKGRLTRYAGGSLCGRSGWYERPLRATEEATKCPRCVDMAERYGVHIQ